MAIRTSSSARRVNSGAGMIEVPVRSTTPAAKLASAEVVEKPDIVATDCGANNFFGQFYLGFWRFCGTSAAAPHAAAVIALMHQANPAKSPAQLRTAMTGTAKAVAGYGPNVVGKGLVQARQAVEALPPAGPINDPASTLITPPPPEPPVGPVAPVDPVVPNPAATAKQKEAAKEEKRRAAPKARIQVHPAKLLKSQVGRVKVTFKFKADQKGAKFECSVDKAKWKTCAATFKPLLVVGPHEVKVRARGAEGSVGPVSAYKFAIKLVA